QRIAGAGEVLAEIQAEGTALEAGLRELAGLRECVLSPMEEDYWHCRLMPRSTEDLRPAVHELAARQGWRLRELGLRRLTLEDVFVHMTSGDEEMEGWE
ncbi:MAG: hypothetical protein KDM81_21455, partial [Verrucomicrobiae bacterium]|nr:hypothetical protein [Verrucomicrobiae bacterium]